MNRLLETSEHNGYIKRRYQMPDGRMTTSFEVGEPLVIEADIRRLVRRGMPGRDNLLQYSHLRVDPDKIDAVLEALDGDETHRQIAKRLKVSSKTIQKIRRGY